MTCSVRRSRPQLRPECAMGRHIEYATTQLALIRTLRGLTPRFGFFDDEAGDESGFEPARLAQTRPQAQGGL